MPQLTANHVKVMQAAQEQWLADRMRRADQLFAPDPVPPWFNLNSPLLDALEAPTPAP